MTKPGPGKNRTKSNRSQRFRRGTGDSMYAQGDHTQHGKPDTVAARDRQRIAREGQIRPCRVADRPVVPMTPSNAGRGKGPWFKASARRSENRRIGMNLITPQKVRKLQAALHAKAKRSPDCRFHQLYDKVYREDIESYGVERWLGELTPTRPTTAASVATSQTQGAGPGNLTLPYRTSLRGVGSGSARTAAAYRLVGASMSP